jgi:hypothetical protein
VKKGLKALRENRIKSLPSPDVGGGASIGILDFVHEERNKDCGIPAIDPSSREGY